MGARLTGRRPERPEPDLIAAAVADAGRAWTGRVLAATLRSVGNLDIAEESTADAFVLALQSWPKSGVPTSVEAWLIIAARRRALDRIRRAQAGRRVLLRQAAERRPAAADPSELIEATLAGDDELRMVVLCCDPRLSRDDQAALTLRLACGVPTAAVAAGFGVSTPTMAARLTRAKARLAQGGPRLDLPDDRTVDERLPAVALAVYLAFTLGHTTGAGNALVDDELQDHAQYLAATLHRLRPANPEFTALLALILLSRARAGGRFDDAGTQVMLADADRSRWDSRLLDEGIRLSERALGPTPGPLACAAGIAAAHARAGSWAGTDWAAVVDLYSQLLTVQPSHTVAVGRCVAIGQLLGPAAGLADLAEVLALGGLDRYPHAFAARAFLTEQAGAAGAVGAVDTAADWRRAADLARSTAERAHFTRRAVAHGGRAPTQP